MKSFRLNPDNTFSFTLGALQFCDFRFGAEIAGRSPQERGLPWRQIDAQIEDTAIVATFAHPFLAGLSTVFQAERQGDGLVIQRTIQNHTSHDLYVQEWSDLTGGTVRMGLGTEVYSTENCCVSFLRLCWDDSAAGLPAERPQEFGTFINAL
jgi:hypothetical protein